MKKRLIVVVIFILAVYGCAPPAIRTTALVPAQSMEAAKLKDVAVMPFDGKGGKEFASEIEGMLASINIDDKQYFTVVDRAKITEVMDKETTLSQSGFVDPQTAAKIGKMVGAKGIYTGTVTTSDTNDSHYNEERTKCAYMVTKKNEEGKSYQECGQWKQYTVPCTKRSATFSFTPKLIEVESGRVVYANNLTGTADRSACSDSATPLPGGLEILSDAKKRATAMLRREIAPFYVTFEVKLMDSTDGVTHKDAEQKLKDGLNFATNNRFDRACELWGEARVLSPNSPSIIYNLGVCAETTGRLEEALDLYKKTDKLLNKPDDRITLALRRVQATIQNQKKLKEQK